jgi:hypothetical protein
VSTAGGYVFSNLDNGISELILAPPFPGSLVGKTGTIQLKTGNLTTSTGSFYSEGTGTGLLKPVRGNVTSVPVPEASPGAMLSAASVGWMMLARGRFVSRGVL